MFSQIQKVIVYSSVQNKYKTNIINIYIYTVDCCFI